MTQKADSATALLQELLDDAVRALAAHPRARRKSFELVRAEARVETLAWALARLSNGGRTGYGTFLADSTERAIGYRTSHAALITGRLA